LCGEKNFKYHDKKEILKYGLDKFYCLADKSYSFQGGFYSDLMSYLEVKLYKCLNSSTDSADSVIC